MPRSLPPGRPAVDRQRVGSLAGSRPIDVPRRLGRQPAVTHSGDAGGFYCEHAFFTAQEVAATASVRRNGHGELLVGFLHVPGSADRWLTGAHPPDPAKRHGRTRRVVGRALAGFVTEILASGLPQDEPIRLLVTGFGPWGAVVDNPTGDFVRESANLEAALALGLGSALAAPPVVTPAAPWRLDVTARLGGSHGQRSVLLCGWHLPTSDEALDPAAAHALPSAIVGPLRPHAVLSLGVACRRRRFYVEHTATDANLIDGRHQEAAPRQVLAPNYALARAIRRGGEASC